MAHPLAHVLDQAAHGRFPEPDGRVEVVGSTGGYADALVAFTGHWMLAADVNAAEVLRRAPVGDFSVPFSVEFLAWVSEQTGRRAVGQDLVCVGMARAGVSEIALERIEDVEHPRVRRAKRYRDDVRVYTTPDAAGVLVLGRGLTRRWEVAFEVDEAVRNRGLGRRLAAAALHLLPSGTAVWAQVAPANAASVRAVTGAGFRPVGSESLFVR